MSSKHLAALTQWITPAAVQHGRQLPEHLMQRLGLQRRAVMQLLGELVALQWLTTEREGRLTLYRPGALRQVVQRYALVGLQEDLPWRRDFAPCFEMPASIARMVQHGFTELLNNAVDHSGGKSVTVSLRQTPLQMQLLVSDDGCGLFERIEQSFGIADPQLALLELSKGKLSSAPERHSGQGLFFTARLADVLSVHANGAAFQRRAWDRQPWHRGKPANRGGTSVYMAIALDSPRTLDTVLAAHNLQPGGLSFDHTEVPLQLLAEGGVLASRAEARRAVARLTQFCSAQVSFAGVEDLGHGFADEMFRVFARANPGVQLMPVDMSPRVAAMVAAAGGAAAARTVSAPGRP